MNITSFLIYCVIVTFTPGPTNIAVLSMVHHFGFKKAFQYVIGATAAFGMLVAASVVLNSLLIAVVPKILVVMQTIGSFYILYLAYQVFKMDISGDDAQQRASFLSGFLMQFVNPKVWLFTMTVIPTYVMPYFKSSLILSIFVIVLTTIGFSAIATWALFGTVFKGFLQKYQKATNTTLAVFLVYSAIEVSGLSEIFMR